MIALEKLLIYLADLYINYRPTALFLISILSASAVALVIGAISEARTAKRYGLVNSNYTLDSYSERFLSVGQEFQDGFVKGLKSEQEEKKGELNE